MSEAPPEVQAETKLEAVAGRRPLRVFGAGPGWRGALREFGIIVAGVLAALAAQALWEGHGERERERSYVAQLLSETRENEARLLEAIAQDSVSRIGARRMMDALTTTAPVPADSFVTWLAAAGTTGEFRPLSGSFRALLQSGDLRLIRNDTLRAAISQYAGSLEVEAARLVQLRGMILDAIAGLAREMPFARRIFIAGIDPADVDVDALRRDSDAIAVLFVLHASNENRMNNLTPMLRETTRLRQALERAVGVPSTDSPADSAP